MEFDERLAALEERVSALEGQPKPAPMGAFWALEGVKDRMPDGAVLFAGAVPLPTGHHYEWQQGETVENLLGADWSELSASFAALGHPVRLLLLRLVLTGVQTTAELQEHEALGTTGQLYHHLRQLVAAGWLHLTGRGHYSVPGAKVVPLLTVLTAVRDPA